MQLRPILELCLLVTILGDIGLPSVEAKAVLLMPRRRSDYHSGYIGGHGMMRSFQAMREDPRSIYRKTSRRGGLFDEPLPSTTQRWGHDKEPSDWNANDVSGSLSVSEENEPTSGNVFSVLNDQGSLEGNTTPVTRQSASAAIFAPPDATVISSSTTTTTEEISYPVSSTSTSAATTSASTTSSTTTSGTTTPAPSQTQKEVESSTVKSRILRKSCGIRCGLF